LNLITTNVISRVYQFRFGKGTATCFTLDFDSKQYLVTAKHAVEGIKDEDEIEIQRDQKWNRVGISVIGVHETADVAVLKLPMIIRSYPADPSPDKMSYGQEVYFLGFPYQLRDDTGSEVNRKFPFPLVKRAILSGTTSNNGSEIFLLDGINNPGFSGGPVVFVPNGEERNKQRFKIMGVIASYRYEKLPVLRHGDGATPFYVKGNTGIIQAYNIKNVIELIKENPVGNDFS